MIYEIPRACADTLQYHITIPRRHHTHTLKDKIDDKFHSSNPQVVANTRVSAK